MPPLQVAADVAPSDRGLQHYVGALHAHYGHNQQAASIFGRLIEADPSDSASRLELARALIGSGDAYGAFRQLRVLPPSGEVTTDMYLAGLVAQDADRHREGARILQEVVRRDPSLFDVEERIAEAASSADERRFGAYETIEMVSAQEAYVLHRARHPEKGEALLLAFRRDASDGLSFPDAFGETVERLRGVRAAAATILDAGSDEEAYYVVYATPEGTPLTETCQDGGALPALEAASSMVAVADALGAIHAADEIHGDLRPSAVWLDDDANATLVGVGMAAITETDDDAAAPASRSPYHVAPEVVRREVATTSADVYSAGCILYQLLTGSPPLEGPTHLATMMAHVTVEIEPASLRVPNVPSVLDEVIAIALSKDARERYQTGDELAEALRTVIAVEAAVDDETEAAPRLVVPAAMDGDGSGSGPEVIDLTPRAPSGGEAPDPERWWTYYDETVLVANARHAKVYRGFHRQTGEPHAIKHLQVPQPLSTGDDAGWSRASRAIARLFQNEMHVLQVLSEEDPPLPGIVTMLQAYRADETSPAYAMPLMGESLAQRIGRGGPLDEGDATAIILGLCTVVGELHERSMVHRNISPRSVMLARDEHAYLGGFDRACYLSERGPMPKCRPSRGRRWRRLATWGSCRRRPVAVRSLISGPTSTRLAACCSSWWPARRHLTTATRCRCCWTMSARGPRGSGSGVLRSRRSRRT